MLTSFWNIIFIASIKPRCQYLNVSLLLINKNVLWDLDLEIKFLKDILIYSATFECHDPNSKHSGVWRLQTDRQTDTKTDKHSKRSTELNSNRKYSNQTILMIPTIILVTLAY